MNNYLNEDEYNEIMKAFNRYADGENLKSQLRGLIWRLLKMPDTRGFTRLQIQGSNDQNRGYI